MGSAISSIAAASMNRNSVQETNQTNRIISAEQNQAQAKENLKDRIFQAEESQKAFDRSVEQWNRENAYNAPIEQLKRFQEAGINPTLGLLGNVAMPAANSPTMQPAKGSNSSLPNPIPMQPAAVWSPLDFAKDLKDLSEAKKNVAEAEKSGAETHSINSTLDSMVKKMSNEADMAEFQNWLNREFGVKRYTAETNKIVEETFEATSKALLAAKQGDEAEANKQMLLALKNLHEKEAGLKQKDIDSYDELLKYRIENILSDTQANKATAENQRAQADYSRDSILNNQEQRKLFAQEVLETVARLKGVELDNQQKVKLMPLVEESIRKDIRQQGQDYWNPFRYAGTILGGSGTAAAAWMKYVK